MKIFRQLILVFGCYYMGEFLSRGLHLPLPGSLVGMILLFLALQLRLLRLDQIEDTADFLLGHLPFFFIPAGVALMANFFHIQGIWVQILIVCLITTILTMGFSGFSIQKLMERKKSS